jgi:F0F1-type ATP synthase assembly protein I
MMSTALWGLAVVAATAIVVVAIAYALQRGIPHHRREPHNEVAGFVYAVVGVIYAVVLAFVVIVVWEGLGKARDLTYQEANNVVEIAWDANEMAAPYDTQLKEDVRRYATAVADHEWELMATEHHLDPNLSLELDDLRHTAQRIEPQTERQKVIFAQLMQRITDVFDARRERSNIASEGIPGLLWVALVGGGVVTVGYAFLFGTANTLPHALMVVSLACMIAFLLFVVAEAQLPFSGGLRVEPDAFRTILQRFSVI